MTKYYFVRHGESTANINAVSAGWSDVPLSDRGKRQALEVANQIASMNLTFDAIVSSPLSRALDTAKTIAEVNHYSCTNITVIPELKEKSSGSLELGPLEEIFNRTEEEIKQLGGENAEMFQERVKIALDIIRREGEGRRSVLIVAHSGIYKMAKVLHDKLEPATKMYEVEVPKNTTLLKMPMADD